jgi:adenylyl-sulfate kinase
MTEHQGFTVWFTGLPCCGKTTVADRVAVILREKGYRVERLDGDIVREGLTNDLGFSKKDRDENIRRIAFVANMLSRNNVIVLATFVSPYRAARRSARREIGRFVEVYVRCPIEICMKRDVKGMYQKAREGKITHFTGVDDPYEEPERPELILDTDKEPVDESVQKVLQTLVKLQYIS